MTVSGIGSAGGIQNKAPSADLQSIEQKIIKLQEQLKKVKEDEKLPPEEKQKKIQKLEEQIKRLEEQKRKLEQKEQQKKGTPGEETEKRTFGPSLDEAMGTHVDTWG